MNIRDIIDIGTKYIHKDIIDIGIKYRHNRYMYKV